MLSSVFLIDLSVRIVLCCIDVMQESFVQLGLNRNILNQEPLFNTFTKSFPSAMAYLDELNSTLFGVLIPVIKFLTMIGDVPDAMATFKVQICTVRSANAHIYPHCKDFIICGNIYRFIVTTYVMLLIICRTLVLCLESIFWYVLHNICLLA